MKSSTIKEMIENSVLLYPNNIAFYEKENKEYKGITYSELYSDMVNLGNKLIDMGLKDKNIAIIGKNSYEWGLSYLTTVCGVGKVVPLDKELKKEELDKQLNNLNVDLIIYSKEQEKKLDHNKYKTIRMQDEMKELIKNLRKINPSVDANIFKAMDNVNMNCILSWHKDGANHSFLDDYDKK